MLKINARGLALAIVCAFGAGCAGIKVPLQSGPNNPAARGTLRVSTEDNQNTGIEVEVNHLAEPSRINPGASSYVVWVQPRATESQAQNLGALQVDRNLQGKLKTVIPYQDFRVFITAEPSAMVNEPSGDPVLWADINRGAEHAG
jgi:hypothetical protein